MSSVAKKHCRCGRGWQGGVPMESELEAPQVRQRVARGGVPMQSELEAPQVRQRVARGGVPMQSGRNPWTSRPIETQPCKGDRTDRRCENPQQF